MTSGSFWNCYRDEINDDGNENDAANNNGINNNKAITSKSFEYKSKRIGRTPDDYITEIIVLLKYLSNFWRFLNLLLKINLICHGQKNQQSNICHLLVQDLEICDFQIKLSYSFMFLKTEMELTDNNANMNNIYNIYINIYIQHK